MRLKTPPPPKTAAAPMVTAPKAPIQEITPPKAPAPRAVLPKAPMAKASQPKKAATRTLAPPPPPPPPPAAVMPMTPKAAPASTASTKPVPKSAAAPVKAAAKPQIKPQAKRQQLAALTPSGDSLLQVRFRAGSSALTRGDEDLLKTMADKVAATEARLQLKAYAEGSGNDTSKARRLSLSRALAVRSFLIENGLRSTRIDVRALGIARDGGAPDRVDILLLQR
ncbi:MAG: OmpA family protein, partial [Rhodospirillaceae bacterium]|nr:OmpA family protein [Rhodospirillaceae bacterium]